MPLVPLSIVSRWYQTDSWVYRAFKRTYQNQLWDCQVPKGYSLCPYFWQAILVGMLLVPLLTVIWFLTTPLRKLTVWLNDQGWLGGTIVGLMGASFTLSVYFAAAKVHTRVITGSIMQLVVITMASALYYVWWRENRRDTVRCRVEYYVGLSALFAAVALAVKYPFIVTRWPHVVLAAIYHAVLTPIGHFLTRTLPHALMAVAHWVASWFVWGDWSALKWPAIVLGSLIALALAYDWYDRRSTHATSAKVDGELLGWDDASWRYRAWLYDQPADYQPGMTLRAFDSLCSWLSKWVLGSATEDRLRQPNLTDDDYRAITAQLDAEFRASEARRKAREDQLDRLCKRVSSMACMLWKPISVLVWRPVRWVAVQAFTLVVMIVTVIKSRKQGFCPYLRFTDTTATTASTTTGGQSS